MIAFLRRYFFQHASLLVIMFGALSFFASNIIMKEILSSVIYGHLSLIITYFSLIYVFGILGTEQVFLRFSKSAEKNQIETQKTLIFLVLGFTFLSATAGTFIFENYYTELKINPILLFFSSLSIIGSMFLFSILRLNSSFVLSQILANGWKIGMFLLAVLFFVFRKSNLDLFIESISVIAIVFFSFFLFYTFKTIRFKFNTEVSNTELFVSAFHFFISIASFSLVIFADRFIVENKYDFAEFGNFFYLCNFFLAPFSILQNYVGFKQLIHFKTNFNKKYFISFSKRIVVYGILLALFLFAVTFFLSYYKWLKFSFDQYLTIIILLLVSGIARLFSSSISAAFEAITSIKTLRRSNLYVIVITILILANTYFFVDSIEMIVVNFIFIWLLRSFIYRQLLLHQIKKES